MEDNYNEVNQTGQVDDKGDVSQAEISEQESADTGFTLVGEAKTVEETKRPEQTVKETQAEQHDAQASQRQAQTTGQQSEGTQNFYQSNAYSMNQNGNGAQNAYNAGQNTYGYGQNTYGYGQNAYGSNPNNYSNGSAYGSNTYQAGQGNYNAGQYGANQGSYNAGQYGAGWNTYRAGQGSNQNPYGTGQNSYGSNQNTYGAGQNAYGAGQNPYQQPYQQQAKPAKAKKPKKPKKTKDPNSKWNGFGVLLTKVVVCALVFALVAGLVFTGVAYVGTRSTGILAGVKDAQTGDATSSVGTTSTTGVATDLVDVQTIAAEVMPSIVAITNIATVTTNSFFGQYSYDTESLGSGIIIAQDKKYLYISTNNHVVSGANTLTVQFVDDTTVSAEVTGTDESDDLAVVQVELSSIEADTLAQIKVATVDDSDNVAVGQAVIAIGNALGYGQSVTTGVVSAVNRTVTVEDETTGTTVTNTDLIQTDAAINAGNSGGALLNAAGAVIGINSAKYSGTGVEGIGYAIPMSDAYPIIQAIIAGEDIPQSAYLGISGQSVSSDVSSVYGVPEGVLVVEVMDGEAAQKAGISAGDIITAFEGTAITTMDELKLNLAAYKEGDTVTLTVAKKAAGYVTSDVTVTLGGQSTSK